MKVLFSSLIFVMTMNALSRERHILLDFFLSLCHYFVSDYVYKNCLKKSFQVKTLVQDIKEIMTLYEIINLPMM